MVQVACTLIQHQPVDPPKSPAAIPVKESWLAALKYELSFFLISSGLVVMLVFISEKKKFIDVQGKAKTAVISQAHLTKAQKFLLEFMDLPFSFVISRKMVKGLDTHTLFNVFSFMLMTIYIVVSH